MLIINLWNIITWKICVIQKLKSCYLLLLYIRYWILIKLLAVGWLKASNIVSYTSFTLNINLIIVSIKLILLQLLRDMICKFCWLLIVWIYTGAYSFMTICCLIFRLKRLILWADCISCSCTALILNTIG